MKVRLFVIASMLIACDGPRVDEDSGIARDAAITCASDRDCDDGLFCTGVERCDPSDSNANRFGCVRAERACMPSQECDEDANACTTLCDVEADADSDGHDAIRCGGDDCDDANADRYPGNLEVCDADDEDCDPATVGDLSADHDAFVSSACCNEAPGGFPYCGTDCDDTRADVNPETSEVCDRVDNDCDGAIDEGLPAFGWYPDCDGDLFGDASASPIVACAMPSDAPASCASAGWAPSGDDCDDTEPAINPRATEGCNGIDDNCDGRLEGPGEDRDGDGSASPRCGGDDCNDADASVHPGATELCNGRDDDCDGAPSIGEDADGDGTLGAGAICAGGPLDALPRTDCDDRVAAVHAGASEICNGVDDDCDGAIDQEPAATASCSVSGATTACDAGACRVTACDGTALDCDGDASNGCEEDRLTSRLHCGACTNACGWDCASGACDDPIDVSVDDGGCVVRASGSVFCWGSNTYGELGIGTVGGESLTPVAVIGITDAIRVSVGDGHACALRAGGGVSCWGRNDAGVLGDGTTIARPSPTPVAGLSDAIDLDASSGHACAVRRTGAVVCWGRGTSGQLGDGSTSSSNVPVTVAALAEAVQVAVGRGHSCARRASGTVACWGYNWGGNLGSGTFTAPRPLPVAVSGVADAIDLDVGDDNACVVRAGGQLSCWGADSGLLGRAGSYESYSAVPVDPTGVSNVASVVMGADRWCVVRTSGQLACHGAAPVGDGSVYGTRTAIDVPGMTDALRASVGYDTCALRSSRQLWCWGSSVGDGTTETRTTPVEVLP